MGGVLGVLLANKTVSSVMATGGQLVYDLRGYRYHVFTSAGQTAPGQPNAVGAAGSFVVQKNDDNKLFDILCVGGGGAGGTTPSTQAGAGGGGGGAVTEFFNIPITLPSPGTPVAFPVYVGVGAGYAVPTNVGGAVSIGGTQFPNGVSNPFYITTLAQFNSRFGDTPLGYTAAGGAPAGNYPSSQVSSYGYPAGASGNGNPGGDNLSFPQTISTRRGGSGGGGAGGAGIPGSPYWPTPVSPTYSAPGTYYPTAYPSASGGIGGAGATSTIAQPDSPHGNVFGGGGGGGAGVPANFPLPVVPNASGGTGGGGYGGAWPTIFGSEGGTNTGGGGGGQGAVPSGSSGPVRYGGPGIVVVRYPYP